MQIFNLQISKNDLTRREIRKYRVICSIDNLIRLIYILKENNLQNIKLNCETNPLQSLQKAISSEFDISTGVSAKIKHCNNSLHIISSSQQRPRPSSYVRCVQYPNTSLPAPSLQAPLAGENLDWRHWATTSYFHHQPLSPCDPGLLEHRPDSVPGLREEI